MAAAAAAEGEADVGGWVELLDARWGRLYYYQAGTGRTQWERPPGFRGVRSVGSRAVVDGKDWGRGG